MMILMRACRAGRWSAELRRRPGTSVGLDPLIVYDHPVERLDLAMVQRGLAETREKARRSILAGKVKVNGVVVSKAGHSTRASDHVELLLPERFVSRGGEKLQHALDSFQLAAQGLTCLDIGASTGGFTDCLLQAGAARVYAVDVGRGQLAWKLRNDPRVIPMERVNARYLTRAQLGASFTGADLAAIDCSFISLQKILPPIVALLRSSGKILALIKPQFQAGREEASRGQGVIRDPAVHARVIAELVAFVDSEHGLLWKGVVESPILGPAGNKEFLAWIEKAG